MLWKVLAIIAVVVIVLCELLFRCQRCGGLHGGFFCFRRIPGRFSDF